MKSSSSENLFAIKVSASPRGGLLLTDPAGNQVHAVDGQVEDLIEEMERVRRMQLRRECAAICGSLGFPGSP